MFQFNGALVTCFLSSVLLFVFQVNGAVVTRFPHKVQFGGGLFAFVFIANGRIMVVKTSFGVIVDYDGVHRTNVLVSKEYW